MQKRKKRKEISLKKDRFITFLWRLWLSSGKKWMINHKKDLLKIKISKSTHDKKFQNARISSLTTETVSHKSSGTKKSCFLVSNTLIDIAIFLLLLFLYYHCFFLRRHVTRIWAKLYLKYSFFTINKRINNNKQIYGKSFIFLIKVITEKNFYEVLFFLLYWKSISGKIFCSYKCFASL